MLAARVEQKNILLGREEGEQARKHSAATVRTGEQIKLARVVVGRGRDGLVMPAYLSEVGGLELQGEVHQRLGNIGGGFIGRGVFGQWIAGLGHRDGGLGLYASISSFMRKLLPSMMTVSAWCRTRSRMAEVKVLSLLKICDQCL